jgi:hypothetical protein
MNLVGTIRCPNREAAQIIESSLHKVFGKHRIVREWFSWNSCTKHFIYYFLQWEEYNTFVDKYLACLDEVE